MPERCTAANCGNTHKDKVSLFKFPSSETDHERFSAWVRQVKRTRDDWTGPTKYSRLCSAHFTADQFEEVPKLKMSLGFTVQHPKVLKANALPTIFKHSEGLKPSTSGKIRQPALQKLQRKHAVESSLLNHQSTTNTVSDSEASTKENTAMVQHAGVPSLLNHQSSTNTVSDSEEVTNENTAMVQHARIGPQTYDPETQTGYISKQSRASQIYPKKPNWGCGGAVVRHSPPTSAGMSSILGHDSKRGSWELLTDGRWFTVQNLDQLVCTDSSTRELNITI